MSNANNHHDKVYCYFVCAERHSKRTTSTRQAILIEDVEHLIENHYTRVQITPAQQEALSGMLHHEQDRPMKAHYPDARAHLDDTLNLLANCAEICTRCYNANRGYVAKPSSPGSTSTKTTNSASRTTTPSKRSSPPDQRPHLNPGQQQGPN